MTTTLQIGVDIRGVGEFTVELEKPDNFDVMPQWEREEWLTASMERVISYYVKTSDFYQEE